MKSKTFAFLLVMVLCLSMTAPVALAAEAGSENTEPVETVTADESAPDLPKVYSGASISSNVRTTYTEATRPSRECVINSVVDNPDYGNEFNFLTITNATTGEAWRAGTMELVAGEQYLVEIYCRNDGTDTGMNGYNDITACVKMPFELGAGKAADFSAVIKTGSEQVNTAISVVARTGVSVQYVADTAQLKRSGSRSISRSLEYEKLFSGGVSLAAGYRVKAGDVCIVSFAIQIVADDSVPVADANFDYNTLSPAGTGFRTVTTTEAGGENVANEPAADDVVSGAEEAETGDAFGSNKEANVSALVVAVAVVVSLVVGCCVGVAVATKKQKSS